MMQTQEMMAVIMDKFGQTPYCGPKSFPVLNKSEVLVKVEASTINPVDHIFMCGRFTKKVPPVTPGYEGVGRIVKVGSHELEPFKGKRVCFIASSGSWAEYSATSIYFVISEDVDTMSAAAGIINPLTVLAMIYIYRVKSHQGIINTAAASALGRQLNKICISYKIPLINIVRRREQAEILRSQGATYVIVTQGNWEKQYRQLQSEHKYDLFFDALGGGSVTSKILQHLPLPCAVHIYGILEDKPLVIPKASKFFLGFSIKPFNIWVWWKNCPEQDRQNIRRAYSQLLKAELSTTKYHQYSFRDIVQAIKDSKIHPTRGKILLIP